MDEIKGYIGLSPKNALESMKRNESIIDRLTKAFYVKNRNVNYTMHDIFLYYQSLLEEYPDNRIADTVYNRIKRPHIDDRLIDHITFERFLLKSSASDLSKLVVRYVYETRLTDIKNVTALDIEASSCSITTKNLCWSIINRLGYTSNECIFDKADVGNAARRIFGAGIKLKELIR